MKKTISTAAAVLCTLAVVALAFAFGDRPFLALDAGEVRSATVRLSPPDRTVEVADTDTLVALLRGVVTYRRDDSYAEYAGQAVTFTLAMADGTLREVTEYSPFLIVDGVGYRAGGEACEALSRYANTLLDSRDAVVVLERPPALTVASDSTACAGLLGSDEWQRKLPDGSREHVTTDALHPLDCRELLTPLETGSDTAVLRFSEEPDEILNVRCWSDSLWGEVYAEGEAIAVNGHEISLRPGGYVYEVRAVWDASDGYGGDASYYFYIRAAELTP